MKIYVAGKFENYKQVQEVQELARKHGHRITHDWTDIAQAAESGDIDTKNEVTLRQCAQADAWGVKTCHVFIGIYHPHQFGTTVEFGMALALNKEVWLVGDWQPADSPFFFVPHIRYLRFNDTSDLGFELKRTATEGITRV